tara:strand:- start:377 stop:499 length:123 start_codon:yes stop_codon:yes gene_type:complete
MKKIITKKIKTTKQVDIFMALENLTILFLNFFFFVFGFSH